MIRVAIVDDDPLVVSRLSAAVEAAGDMRLEAVARNIATGRELVAAGGFDVLLCDLGLPDGSGVELIREASARYPEADVIVVTVFGDQGKVLESIRAGARGYLLKDDRIERCAEGIREIRAGGSPISPVIARQLVRQLGGAGAAPAADDDEGGRLSDREAEVLNLLARGFSYAEVAGFLSLSPATVGTYVKRIYRKLQVRSRSEAVFEASSRGILSVH